MRFDFGSDDTESDSAQDQIRAAAIEAANEQGGTELSDALETVPTPGVEFPIETDRVNSDPMGNSWEMERAAYGNDGCCEDGDTEYEDD